MTSYYEEYIKLGFNPSTILITCDFSPQSKVEYIRKNEKVKITFIKSYKSYAFDSSFVIRYFSTNYDTVIHKEVIEDKDTIVSASALRFVDLSLSPFSKIYDQILKSLVLNPILVKGGVDDLFFERIDVFFAWGKAKEFARFNNFKPTHACIVGSFGKLAFLSIFNRYLLGYLKLDDRIIDYVKREKDKIVNESALIYKELGETIKANEDNLVYAEEIGKSDVVKRFKEIGIRAIPVYDERIVRFVSNIMKNPLASPFCALILGNKTGIENVIDKALSLGLNVHKIEGQNLSNTTF